MTDLTDEELMMCSYGDEEIFREATKDLPTLIGFAGTTYDKYGLKIPYGSGPHIVKHFRETLEIVRPKRILEIGFNLGYGAAIFLAISEAKMVSTDISDKDETIAGAKYLEEKYDGRFRFYIRKDLPKLRHYFDLMFIDGDHSEAGVTEDIQLAKDLNIPYLLFDDWYERFGPGVQPAFAKFPLKVIKDMHNLKLATWEKH